MNAVARLLSAEPVAPPDIDARWPSSWLRADSPTGTGILYRGARGVFIRFVVGSGWLMLVTSAWFNHPRSATLTYLVPAILVCALAFSAAVPLVWMLPYGRRIWIALGLLAITAVLWPALGWGVVATWPLVAVLIGSCMFRTRTTAAFALALGALALLFQYLDGETSSALVWLPAVITSIAMMISGFSRQRAAIAQLRATQHELAALAVAEERGRVARDIHDILGHSLTAITVRAELTGMLIDAGRPADARDEVAAVEDLARGALADVRSTVAGYRGVTAAGELANARTMLESAGIRAELPTTIDELPARLHELAGWVIREAVTNVVRHSDARRCRIMIDATGVEIADDGSGPSCGNAPNSATSGNGLRGLRERAEAAGCSILVGRSDLGGFGLRLSEGRDHG